MKRVLIIMALVAVVSCKGRGQQEQSSEKFPMVAVPATLANEAEAYSYVALHFWDNFDLADTAKLNKPYVKQAFAEYLNLLAQMPQNVRQQSVDKLLNRAYKSEAGYERMAEMLEEALYNISSPLHNEETYNAVLLWQINNPAIEEVYKLRPKELYRIAQQNRVGSFAADFTYALASGGRTTLYNTRAQFTILFFYNLGCEMCRTLREQMLEYIAAAPAIGQMIDDGRLKILALYPDKERESWEKYRGDIPPTWINGYDPTGAIKDREIYELRAIPSVYVLTSDKRVIVKDAFDAQQIFEAILRYGD